MRQPKTFVELFEFYQSKVKLFYSAVQAENELPTEILFEINAAFDHVSRYHVYGQSEEEVVAKAYSHLKRACLDVFKGAHHFCNCFRARRRRSYKTC